MKRRNRIGEVHNRLTVEAFSGLSKSGNSKWQCRCTCGNSVVVVDNDMLNDNTQSCDYFGREQVLKAKITHGASRNGKCTRTYICWANIKARCQNPNSEDFHRYGGRGIAICDRWNDSFTNFQDDMGECSEGMEIDRINNDGNYEPSNCRYVVEKVQANNRSTNVRLTYLGKTQTIAEWTRELGFSGTIIYLRLRKGMSVKQALTTPHRYNGRINTILRTLPHPC